MNETGSTLSSGRPLDLTQTQQPNMEQCRFDYETLNPHNEDQLWFLNILLGLLSGDHDLIISLTRCWSASSPSPDWEERRHHETDLDKTGSTEATDRSWSILNCFWYLQMTRLLNPDLRIKVQLKLVTKVLGKVWSDDGARWKVRGSITL